MKLALQRFGIDWQAVAIGLFREVEDGARLSHGAGNPFVVEIGAFGEGLGIAGRAVGSGLLEREWGKLRMVADADI